MNYTTILYLTSKELNKEPLDHLQRMLKESPADDKGDGMENIHEFLHAKLFGDRDDVAKVLNDERELNEIFLLIRKKKSYRFSIRIDFNFSEKS